jgi:hypothetical protein
MLSRLHQPGGQDERHGQARVKQKTSSYHHQLMVGGEGTYLCCLRTYFSFIIIEAFHSYEM